MAEKKWLRFQPRVSHAKADTASALAQSIVSPPQQLRSESQGRTRLGTSGDLHSSIMSQDVEFTEQPDRAAPFLLLLLHSSEHLGVLSM